MKHITRLACMALVALIGAGCMSPYYGRYEREERLAADTLQAPAMTTDDVIALARDSVSDDVIISQIKATNTYFQLTTDDIIRLKKAGVNEKVINAMIKTAEPPKSGRGLRRYSYYPAYYPYYPGYYPYTGYYYSYPYYYSYGYPRYSSFYLGLSFPHYGYGGFYGGHYGGVHYSGGHFGGHGYSGGHGFGGHR